MIKNITRNTIIAEHEFTAKTFFRRATGLIFKKFSDGGTDALVFKNCSSVHSCFLLDKFDIFFIDKSKKVITLCKDAAPWRIFKAKCRLFQYCIAIECPPGTIAKSKTCVGDILELTTETE